MDLIARTRRRTYDQQKRRSVRENMDRFERYRHPVPCGRSEGYLRQWTILLRVISPSVALPWCRTGRTPAEGWPLPRSGACVSPRT